MRLLLLVITIIIIGCTQNQTDKIQHSTIEKLETNEEVEIFIQQLTKKYDFKLKPFNQFCKELGDSLQISKSFEKTDFDKNGFVDLLINGYPNSGYQGKYLSAIMNYGKDSFQIQTLLQPVFDETCFVPSVIEQNGISIINLHSTSKPKKQLVYKFNKFITFNPKPQKYKIEKIEYSFFIPDFFISYFISISNDRTASYILDSTHLKTYQQITHQHKTKINLKTYHELIEILNYIDFPNLKNKYHSTLSHHPFTMIAITYNNGKTKIIEDNSLDDDELNDLAVLHDKLLALRFNQDWIKTE